jgi:septum formation protein
MAATSSVPFKMILGSSSIARKKILSDMGYQFTIMTADIDEKSIRKDKPEDLVMALAEAKADAILSKLTISEQERGDEPTILISADTAEAILPKLPVCDNVKESAPTLLVTGDQVVVYEGTVREKPSDVEEAWEFIQGYSGGCASTVSSVLVTNLQTGFRKGDWDRVEVHFHDIPNEIIEKLINEGKVLNVAGGLCIEHPLVLPYVKEVIGTTDSVMGLPKAVTERLIKEVL